MLTDKLFVPPIKAHTVSQDFDFIHEMHHSTVYGEVKRRPSLSDYDHSDYDDENTELLLGLNRWGDLQFPTRLIAA